MGLFKSDYNKPGPGVPKNQPRKKGFPRLFEVLGRDIGNLVKLNLIFQLCVLPAEVVLVLLLLTIGSTWFVPCLALGVLAAVPVGPALCALYYCVSKMLRDDPGFVWHDFKRIFKQNFKLTVLPGVVVCAIMGAQAMGYLYFLGSMAEMGVVLLAAFLLSVLVFSMAWPYYFLQAGYLELKNGALLKNSLFLALGYTPRSLAGALLGPGLVGLQAVLLLVFPVSLITLPLIGYTLPCLLGQLFIWKPVNETFEIEQTLRQREELAPDKPVSSPALQQPAEQNPADE